MHSLRNANTAKAHKGNVLGTSWLNPTSTTYYFSFIIKNPFLKEIQFNFRDDIEDDQYANRLNELVLQCCSMDLSERPACEQLLDDLPCTGNLSSANERNLFSPIAVPALDLRKNFSKLNDKTSYLEVNIEKNLKPVSLTSLNSNRNCIVVTVNLIESYDFPSSNGVQSKILIYTEFGDLLTEIQSYKFNERVEFFNFKIYFSCCDQAKSHIYLTTSANDYKIIRLKYAENFECLMFDGAIDLSPHQFKPKIFNLVVSGNADDGSRCVVFSDCFTNRLGCVKLDAENVVDDCVQYGVEWVCEVNFSPIISASSTLFNLNNFPLQVNALPSKSKPTQQRQTIFQILHTKDEVVCLLNDYVTINVFYLKTGLFKRDNKSKIATYNEDHLQPLCIDSDFNLYSCDGHRLFSINLNTFEQYNSVDCVNYQKKSTSQTGHTLNKLPLFASVLYMSILSNGKIVLLQDVVQNENSKLYILKPTLRMEEAT